MATEETMNTSSSENIHSITIYVIIITEINKELESTINQGPAFRYNCFVIIV